MMMIAPWHLQPETKLVKRLAHQRQLWGNVFDTKLNEIKAELLVIPDPQVVTSLFNHHTMSTFAMMFVSSITTQMMKSALKHPRLETKWLIRKKQRR
jgi:hypothetical protein